MEPNGLGESLTSANRKMGGKFQAIRIDHFEEVDGPLETQEEYAQSTAGGLKLNFTQIALLISAK